MASQGFGPLLLAPRPGCWVSLSPPVPSFSLPQPVVRSATSFAPRSRPFGFCFCCSFRSSLVTSAASVEVSSDPLVRVPTSFPGSVCPASLLLCLFAVCALLQTSGFSQSPLRLSFLIRVSSSGSILEFSLPSLATQSSVALAALLGSIYPVHLSLLALFARPLLPFLFFLGFYSMGLLL